MKHTDELKPPRHITTPTLTYFLTDLDTAADIRVRENYGCLNNRRGSTRRYEGFRYEGEDAR